MSLLNLLDLPIRHSDILMIPSLVIGSNFSIDPLSTLLATTDFPPPSLSIKNNVIPAKTNPPPFPASTSDE